MRVACTGGVALYAQLFTWKLEIVVSAHKDKLVGKDTVGQQCWLQHGHVGCSSGALGRLPWPLQRQSVTGLEGLRCSSPLLKSLGLLDIKLHRFNHEWLQCPQSCPRHLQATDAWVTWQSCAHSRSLAALCL